MGRGSEDGSGVVERDGPVPWTVLDAAGEPVGVVEAYLAELAASDCSALTIRAYAYDLLAWWRFLAVRGVAWDEAGRVDVRDYVLDLRGRDNPYRHRRSDSVPAGVVNARTGKASLADGYAPATINHRLTVISSFYAFHAAAGSGPEANPVPEKAPGGRRRWAHHNPLDPWMPSRRASYRQKNPERTPRAIDDALFAEMFDLLECHRDRAILALLVSTGARANELLGLRGADLDWGGQRVRLVGKGSRQGAWVAASAESFTWLARYLTEREPLVPAGPVWLTLRRPFRPLNYSALRGVLNRLNVKTGGNVVAHDFRHTCALRLASDPAVPLIDVQAHLRHQHLSTTQGYLVARPDDVIARVQASQATPPRATPAAARWHYDQADLDTLLGGGR